MTASEKSGVIDLGRVFGLRSKVMACFYLITGHFDRRSAFLIGVSP